ncbi:MAG: O-succinylbenzoic acid--CoA ligase [Parvicellaceae bacterium]
MTKQPIIIDSFKYDESNDYTLLIKNSVGILNEVFVFLKSWYSTDEKIHQKTSGSTGDPKIIELSREMMIASARATCKHFNIVDKSTIHLCLPVDYIAGKMMLIRAMVSGARLIVEEPAGSPLKGNRDKINFCAMTPMQVHGILKEDPTRFDLVKQLIIGGGTVSNVLNRMLQNLNTLCYSTYGMTETATHVAVKNLNGPRRSDLFCAIGKTGFSIDERSCLVLTSFHLDIYDLVTNDVVELADNQAFRWLGRHDNVINTGGIKVFPEFVESKLNGQINSNYFICSIPNEELGEMVVLIVEGAEQSFTFNSLNKFEEPKQVYFTSKFKYTKTGKIQRELTLRMIIDA